MHHIVIALGTLTTLVHCWPHRITSPHICKHSNHRRQHVCKRLNVLPAVHEVCMCLSCCMYVHVYTRFRSILSSPCSEAL